MLLEKLKLPILAGTVCCLACLPVCADSLRRALSESELETLVRQDKALDAGQKFEILGKGPQVTVLAEVLPETREKDMKIDAMFVARSLIEAVPSQIEAVKVIFTRHGKDGKFVIINKLTIERFSKGKISTEDLLSSLIFESIQVDSASKVIPGPMLEARLLVRKRIDDLKEEGTDVRLYDSSFRDLEATVKHGDPEVFTSKLRLLSDRLTDQEYQLAQARKTAAGKGVPAVKPDESLHADRLSRPNKLGASRTLEDRAVLNLFAKRCDDLLRRLSKVSPADSKDALALKRAADDLIASGKEKQAIAKIRQLSAIFERRFGADPFISSGNFSRRARSAKLVNGRGGFPKPRFEQ